MMHPNKHITGKILIFIMVVLAFTQCDDDDYVYPSYLADYMDAYTNSEGVIDRIKPDGSTTVYYLTNPVSGSLAGDTLYRTVGRYKLPDEEGYTTLYSIQLVLTQVPIKRNLYPNVDFPYDPIYIESIYRGGNYLNINAQPLGRDGVQLFNFIEESVTGNSEGNTIVTITLSHDQNGDRESFPRDTYLSVPLSGYNLQKGDSIYFQANLYDEGMKLWKIAY